MVAPVDTLNVPLVNVRNPGDSDEKLLEVTSRISLDVDPTFTFIVLNFVVIPVPEIVCVPDGLFNVIPAALDALGPRFNVPLLIRLPLRVTV